MSLSCFYATFWLLISSQLEINDEKNQLRKKKVANRMLENSENFQKQSRKLYALLKLEQSLQKKL